MHNFAKLNCIALLIVLALTIAPHAVAKENAYLVTQKHYFLGRWQVLINKDRVKATNILEGYSIVTMAPSWKVVFYRDDTHKAWETSMPFFLRTGLVLAGGYVTEAMIERAKAQPNTTYKGLQTTAYTFRRSDLTKMKPAWSLAEVPKEAAVFESRYWTSPVISSQSQICHFMQKIYTLPEANAYPIAFLDKRTDKSVNAILDTMSCKVVAPSETQISYPTNCKLCASQRDVTISGKKYEDMDEFARTLGE